MDAADSLADPNRYPHPITNQPTHQSNKQTKTHMGLFNRSKKRQGSAGPGGPSTPASAAASSTDPHAVSTPASASESPSSSSGGGVLLSPTTEQRAEQAAEPLAALVQALKQKVEAEHAKGPVDNARKRALYYEVRWGGGGEDGGVRVPEGVG